MFEPQQPRDRPKQRGDTGLHVCCCEGEQRGVKVLVPLEESGRWYDAMRWGEPSVHDWTIRVGKLQSFPDFCRAFLFVFSFPLLVNPTNNKKSINANRHWNFTGPINKRTHLDFSFYPKPTCFMHCVVGKCILEKRKEKKKKSCLIWALLEWKRKVFIWPIHSASSCCLHLFICGAASCLWFFRYFPRVDFFFPICAGDMGATGDRLLSRCKLTFRFHN